ncbi:efflux RND transporter permease subunit [Sandaracinus amylolyticus]|uniref:efflux RND transporter permease subunit n=1 Tax=Sandaracinus amylolyticus TaxID=927083 RepID=UPI001F46008D|nr:efflux RND transporter permease subunit [Sandaracinus amylolyticus]UJR86850.1 Hypothetical protein I5071_89510 [Sandaracinus amylolyticus]
MPIVLVALKRPYTVLVAMIAILVGAALAVRRAPADIFPTLNVPVIYVVQPYAGMTPTQMEGQLVSYYEYHFLYVAGVEHVESQSIQGMGVIEIAFHPGTDVAQAMAQVTAMAFRAISFMPPGTLPPFMVRFDAGSIPVGQLVFSSEGRSEAEVQDLALNQVRPLLATLPGVSAPPPSGGRVRTIVGYLDPERMRAYGLSADDVALAVARANPTVPAGNLRVGDLTNIVETSAMVARPADLADVPVRTGSGPTVFVRDVARIEDGADVVSNVALVDGRSTVYMPVTKRADASTLDVVRTVRDALPRMRALVPDDVRIELEFDQSSYVQHAIVGLVEEGLLGALLASLMVLLFLRDWRSALIVVLTIPTSVLAAVVALRLTGQTVNVMTLSGLALSVGILVDEATVAIENVHTHLGRGEEPRRAVVDAMREVTLPRLLAMLCVLAVFIPVFFVTGVAASLFPPLALAVGLAMIASYLVSTAVVPVLSVWLVRAPRRSGRFDRARERYRRGIASVVRWRWLVAPVYLVIAIAVIAGLAPRLGTELFPRVDAGQMQLRIRAPAGTRVERTTEIVREVERMVREEAAGRGVRIALANIGSPQWTFPVNAVYVFNAGPHEATLLVALGGAREPRLPELQARLRRRFADELPGVRVSFEAGDVVSQVMSFGAPTPVLVTVTGRDLRAVRAHAERIEAELARDEALVDVQIPLALDYPAVRVDIDRERTGQQGVTTESVARAVVAATSSSVLTTPIFWTDPASGQPYRVALRVPEAEMRASADLLALPIAQHMGSARPTTLGDVASVFPTTTPGELDRYDNQRTIGISANVAGRDLADAAARVRRALARAGEPPRGLTVAVHGQIEQVEAMVASLEEGLALAVVVVLLLLVAAFQSVREPLAVLSTVPAVLAGVVLALAISGTTLNIQSMMGAITSIGVSVANAVLLVTFARDRRAEGLDRLEAATTAAAARLRPILMTSLAMIAGMLPMALALGGGGEQSSPLGIAIIGGLAASTVATLVALPAIDALIAPRRTGSSSLLPEALEETP